MHRFARYKPYTGWMPNSPTNLSKGMQKSE